MIDAGTGTFKPLADATARRLAAKDSARSVSLGLWPSALMAAVGSPPDFRDSHRAITAQPGDRRDRRGLARLSQASDRGAFLDIGLEFLFYAAIPLGFGMAIPATTLSPPPCCWRHSSAPAPASRLRRDAESAGLKSEAYPTKSFTIWAADRGNRDHRLLSRHVWGRSTSRRSPMFMPPCAR